MISLVSKLKNTHKYNKKKENSCKKTQDFYDFKTIHKIFVLVPYDNSNTV